MDLDRLPSFDSRELPLVDNVPRLPPILNLKERAIDIGLLTDIDGDPRRADALGPPSAKGVSLQWLKTLATFLCETDVGARLTSSEVETQFVVPVMKCTTRLYKEQQALAQGRLYKNKGKDQNQGEECQLSLWELIPPESKGPPNYKLVHMLDTTFSSTVSQVLDRLAPPLPADQPAIDLDKIFLFVDFIITPLNVKNVHPMDKLTLEKEVIRNCSDGVIAVIDPGLSVLRQLWCMYEMGLITRCSTQV
eukprot:gene26373-17467_t